MNQMTVSTSFNIDVEFELAPFHKRLFAWIIDLIIIVLYVVVVINFLDASKLMEGRDSFDALGIAYVTLLAPILCYHLFWELLNRGQSPGKMMLGLRVISEDGGKPSVGQYMLRWMLRLVDFGMTSGMGALLSTLINVKSQRLGDLAAGTILISTRQVREMGNTVFMEIDNKYIPQFPQVMQLTDRDINRIRQLLEYAAEHNDYSRLEEPAQKIKTALKVETLKEPETFMRTLLMDYNYLSTR